MQLSDSVVLHPINMSGTQHSGSWHRQSQAHTSTLHCMRPRTSAKRTLDKMSRVAHQGSCMCTGLLHSRLGAGHSAPTCIGAA